MEKLEIFLIFLVWNGVVGYPRKVPFRAFVDTSDMENSTATSIVEMLRLAEFAFNNRYEHAFDVLLGVRMLPAMPDTAMIWHLQDFICRELKMGFVIGLAGTSATSLGTYSSLLGRMKVPLLDWETPSERLLDSRDGFMFSVKPPIEPILVDYIRLKHWHRIVYIHDGQNTRTLPALYDYLQKVDKTYRLQVDNFRLIEEEEYFRDYLSNFHRRFAIANNTTEKMASSGNIVVVVDLSNHYRFKAFLKALEESILVQAQFHYVFANFEMDENDIYAFRYALINVTEFRLFDRAEKRFQKLKPDIDELFHDRRQSLDEISMSAVLAHDALLTAGEAIELALLNNDEELFKNSFSRHQLYNAGYPGLPCRPEKHEHRPFMPFEHGETLLEALKLVQIDLHDGTITGRIQFDPNTGLRVNYSAQVIEIRTGSGSDQRSIKETMDWHHGIGFAQKNDQTAVKKEANGFDFIRIEEQRRKRKLSIVTVEVKPFVMRKRSPKDASPTPDQPIGFEQLEGYCIDLIKLLAQNLSGFEFDVFISAGNKYGARQDDGSWDGMIGYLLNETADIAVAPLTINQERERVVDFSKPFMTTGISIMIQKPEKQEFEVFSFMQPLGMRIWIFILCSYVAVSITIYLVSSISPYEKHTEKHNDYVVSNELSLYNSLFFTLACFMQQGTDILPRALSGRVASSAWWFFTLIMVSSYTANLAAFLTLERMTPPIESVDDLASQRKILYGIVKGGSTKAFFEDSAVPIYKKMWNFMYNTYQAQLRDSAGLNVTDTIMVNTYAEGIEKVRRSKGSYAFLLEETANEYENTRKPCNTMKVGSNLNTLGYGVATKIGSPWRSSINLAILYLQEKGELKRLENKWWYDRGQCDQGIAESGQSASLNLSKVAGIFYLLSGGMVLALVTALLECIFRNKRRAMQETQTNLPKPKIVNNRAPKLQHRSQSEPAKQRSFTAYI